MSQQNFQQLWEIRTLTTLNLTKGKLKFKDNKWFAKVTSWNLVVLQFELKFVVKVPLPNHNPIIPFYRVEAYN